MKKNPLICFALILIIIGCADKKETRTGKSPSFPVIPFILNQVSHVDTSLYTIMKLTYTDSSAVDTVYVPREQFRALASDFLQLPELTDKKYSDRFTEEMIYDETLNRAIMVCLPKYPAKENIQRQELVVTPNVTGGNSTINNIIVDFVSNSKDSSVQKKMLWWADRSFQIRTIKQLPGQPETITTTKVIWNEPSEQ